MLQFSQFVWTPCYSVWDVFNNFLLLDATDRSKISGDQKRFCIALSLFPLSFFANTPFKVDQFNLELRTFPSVSRVPWYKFWQICPVVPELWSDKQTDRQTGRQTNSFLLHFSNYLYFLCFFHFYILLSFSIICLNFFLFDIPI